MIKKLCESYPVDLIKYLRKAIVEDAVNAFELIASLEKTNRYNSDSEFSCAVNIEKISVLTNFSEYDEIDKIIEDVFKSLSMISNKEIVIEGYTRLALAYHEMGDIENAVKLFALAYKSEEENGNVTIKSANAFNNMAVIYREYGKNDRAIFYFESAYKIYKENDIKLNDLDAITLYIFILSNLVISYSEIKDKDKCQSYMDRLNNVSQGEMVNKSLVIYKEALYFYSNLIENYTVLDKLLAEILSLYYTNKNYSAACSFLKNIYKYGVKKLNDEYIQLLTKNLDIIGTKAMLEDLRTLYLLVLKYAANCGDLNLLTEYYKKLSFIIDKSELKISLGNRKNLDLYVEAYKTKENEEMVSKENLELNKINKEIQTKNLDIKRLYDQTRIITKLGQKITDLSDMYSIHETLHNEFSALMSIDFILLLIKNSENNYFSPYLFNNGDIINNYMIKNCCTIEEIENDILYKYKFPSKLSKIITYCGEEKALLIVQSNSEDAYKEHHNDLFEAVSPYLAIAIINYQYISTLNSQIAALKSDEAELKRLVKYHEKIGNMDLLTRIPNRRCFDKRFDNLLSKSVIDNVPIHVYMIDVDNFKLYNDLNGHVKGDEVLEKVARVLKNVFDSKADLIGRYGGEEFILLTVGGSEEMACEKGRNILENIRDLKIKYDATKDRILTVSVGLVSSYDESNKEKNNLIKMADDCLYEAKTSGKNRIVNKRI